MAKLNSVVQTAPKRKCFLDTDLLKCFTLALGNRIMGFVATYKGKEKIFMVNVKTWDIEKAFKEMETYISKLK
jgi:hypothetical protein